MSLIRPFAGLRPAPGRAAEVIAPPYDVLSTEEARVRAQGRPWNFLHISKPEIDLPAGTDPYSAAVYAKGRENFEKMLKGGRARARPGASLLCLSPGDGRAPPDRHRGGGLGSRLRQQPHPQA
jgi:hypothetical protein